MAVYRKKQPARRPVRRGWKRHARTGMFLFAFALVAVTVGVILPHAGVMSAAAEGSTLTEKIFTTVQNKNLPVIAIDPGHGGTDPGSEGNGLWEYEMTWQVANELVNLLEQDGRYAPVLTITEEESARRTRVQCCCFLSMAIPIRAARPAALNVTPFRRGSNTMTRAWPWPA